jgi:hypothetical protein
MVQLMQLFHYKVYPHNFFYSLHHVISYIFLLVVTAFRFFAEVACELGYDDLDSVTTEDMTLEVKKYSYNENMLRFVKQIIRLSMFFFLVPLFIY